MSSDRSGTTIMTHRPNSGWKCGHLGRLIVVVLLLGVAHQGAWGQYDYPISSITVEADTGLILHEENVDTVRPPASMVKIMKMFMVSEGIRDGRWNLDTEIPVSAHAAGMWGSRIYLREGEVHSLAKMMEAIAVASANDASVAVAEALWGSVDAYLEAATKRARELGMKNTTYRTANGLPPDDGVSFDETTARDMAILARHCVRDPRIMAWAGMKSVQFRPSGPVRSSTNQLLRRMEGCDGLKTGFINAAGYCITATAVRDGIRLITVVMGSSNRNARFDLAENLLDAGFDQMTRYRVVAGGVALGDYVEVNNCEIDQLRLVAKEDLWVTLPKENMDQLELTAVYPEYLNAPIVAGTVVGEVRVTMEDRIVATTPLTVPDDLEAKGWYLVLANGEARWEGLQREPTVQQ